MSMNFNTILTLGKVRITAFVAISSALGYILSNGNADLSMLFMIIGVFILASGSSALNQFQEFRYDALMQRTMRRPIPSGSITPSTGLLIAVLMIIAGESILLLNSGISAFLLGLFAVIWYNVFYTPFKRISAGSSAWCFDRCYSSGNRMGKWWRQFI
jgi:heme o synthase